MTDTFDAVLAEMRAATNSAFETPRYRFKEWADRLSAAHAAEVAERDARIERLFAANEQVMARAEAAERDARELRVDIAKAYAMIPSLPVAPETCDAATDALHYIGLMMGLHDIDPAIATTEQVDHET